MTALRAPRNDRAQIVRAKIELALRLDAQLARFKQQLAAEKAAHVQLELEPPSHGKRVMRALPFTAGKHQPEANPYNA